MKEFDDFKKNLSETIKAFSRLFEKVAQNLEVTSESIMKPQAVEEKEMPAEKEAVARKDTGSKSAPKARYRKLAKKKTTKPKGGVTETVQRVIEENPGINFKSLLKKTGFETKQVRNALPPLKKAGKIKSEGMGIYYPTSAPAKETPAPEEQKKKIEETVE